MTVQPRLMHQIAAGPHQRSKGHAQVIYKPGAEPGRARLERLRQEGSAKAILLPGPEVVFLNTSGGLTGGDQLSYALSVGVGLQITATTQTAERLYRSTSGMASMSVSFDVGSDARLDWLPQETIAFEHAKAVRHTTINLATGGSCLALETVVLGRLAMGETLSRLDLHDWREIRRDGRPVHLETVSLDDAGLRSGLAGLADARALASLVLVAQGAEDALGPARASLGETGVRAAASGFDGRLVIRMMANNPAALRRQISRVLGVLRPDRGLPRVWQS